MASFRIHRMKDGPRQQFRWAPHVSGTASVKPKDYEACGEIEAENDYAAWALLRNSDKPLGVGDILELLASQEASPPASRAIAEQPAAVPGTQPADAGQPSGRLRICKYVGFEDARWVTPEAPPTRPVPHNVVLPEPAQAAGSAQA